MSCSEPLRNSFCRARKCSPIRLQRDFGHIPHDPGFLPFFTTDETQCHHYGRRIVAPNALLWLSFVKVAR